MIRKAKTTSSRLKHRLTLQQEVQTPDGSGGYEKSWTDVVDLWAEILPITSSGSGNGRSSGRETFVAGQIQAEISHRILLRYQDGVTPAMRLLYDGRIFHIKYVANSEERGETLELLVLEGGAA